MSIWTLNVQVMISLFCRKVYKCVCKIPKGKVATYKSVAVLIKSPISSRAVANALSKNFNPNIPCHRVIRSDGFVGGYNRGGFRKKAKLLYDEGVLVKDFKIKSEKFFI